MLKNLFKTKNSQLNDSIILKPITSQDTIEKYEEELFFDWLIDNINNITNELPKSNQTLLNLYKLLLSNEKIKNLKNIFNSYYKYYLVNGTLNGTKHIWIVIGISESCSENCRQSYDFIYQKSKRSKPNSKWIIDLQPLLDNEKPLILEYNSNPQYVPYGNKTTILFFMRMGILTHLPIKPN